MKNLTLFTNLVADLPSGVIEDFYPQPSEIGTETYNLSNYYFGAIRAMLLDDQISSDIDMRKAFAMQVPYVVEGGSSADVAFAREVLAEFDVEDLMLQMLTASEYGYRPIELKWARDGSGIIPVDSEAKRPESFVVLKNGQIGYRRYSYQNVDVVPDGKVAVAFRERSSDKPYGHSILESLWPIWQTKWVNWANIERLGEKYAIPNVVALADGASGEGELQSVADALAPLQNGDSTALSGVKSVEVLSATGKVEEILNTIKYIDNKITYRLTGQTLSTGNQKYGSRSMGETHQLNALFYAKADMKMVFKAMNQSFFPWLFKLNNRTGRLRIKVDEDRFKEMKKTILSGEQIELSDPAEAKHLCLF